MSESDREEFEKCPSCGSTMRNSKGTETAQSSHLLCVGNCPDLWHSAPATTTSQIEAMLQPLRQENASLRERLEKFQTVTDYARNCKTGSGPGDLQAYIEGLWARIAELQAALRQQEHCDLCKQPVRGSVHYEMVSGKHRCCRCMELLRNEPEISGPCQVALAAQPETAEASGQRGK